MSSKQKTLYKCKICDEKEHKVVLYREQKLLHNHYRDVHSLCTCKKNNTRKYGSIVNCDKCTKGVLRGTCFHSHNGIPCYGTFLTKTSYNGHIKHEK